MKDVDVTKIVEEQYIRRGFTIVNTGEVTEATLSMMVTACDNTAHIEQQIKFYDEEDQPEVNNWIDVEGEGYGWLWLQEEGNEDRWHGLIRDAMLGYIAEKKEALVNTTEYFILASHEEDELLAFHFIERDREMKDVVYTFSNKEIDF